MLASDGGKSLALLTFFFCVPNITFIWFLSMSKMIFETSASLWVQKIGKGLNFLSLCLNKKGMRYETGIGIWLD